MEQEAHDILRVALDHEPSTERYLAKLGTSCVDGIIPPDIKVCQRFRRDGESFQIRVGKDLLYTRFTTANVGIHRVYLGCNTPGSVLRPPDVR